MISDADYRSAVDFLYREARLADEARYAEWLALWTDDGVYWVPATGDPAAGLAGLTLEPFQRLIHVDTLHISRQHGRGHMSS